MNRHTASRAVPPPPRVSVLIPSYNRAACLAKSVRAVLAQTMSDFELIVIDDGSTDDTPTCLERVHDARLHVIRLAENQGKSAAVNHGAHRARGTWLMLVDSDDFCVPDRLARQLETAESARTGPVDGVCGRCVYLEDGRRTQRYFPPMDRPIGGPITLKDVLFQNMVSGGTLFVRREAFLAVGGFAPDVYKSIERDFAIRFLQHFTMRGMDDVVLEVNELPHGITRTPAPDSLARILTRHAALYDQTDSKRVARLYYEAGDEFRRLGQQDAAARMFKQSLRRFPCRRYLDCYLEAAKSGWIMRYSMMIYLRWLKIGRGRR